MVKNKTESEKMQCSLGCKQTSNGRWKFNITLFFPSTTGGTFDPARPLIDRINYFVSRSDFGTETEASFFGGLVSDALHLSMVEYDSVDCTFAVLQLGTEKVPCPVDVETEIEEHYKNFGLAEPINADDLFDFEDDVVSKSSDDDEDLLN